MRLIALTSVLGVLTLAGSASAGVIMTYSYNDLRGTYVPSGVDSGDFTGRAANLNGIRTSGEVSRLEQPVGNALFDPGFVDAADFADFEILLAVTNRDNSRADGTGSMTITDIHGDTLTANIVGEWLNGGDGITYFNGFLSAVVFNNESGDNTFDGNGGTFISSDFSPLEPPFIGAIVQLFINTDTLGFLDQGFDRLPTDVDGQVIIPTPGALALFGFAGITMLRRRTR